MKIYFALRLYTGLESSINNKKWLPTGIPTIYKLLETIEKKHEIQVCLFQKTSESMQFSALNASSENKIKFKEFRNSFYIFSKLNKHKLLGRKIHKIFEEIYHTIRILIHILKFRPDIIYIDNANVWAAGIVARIFFKPVVLRILGVYPQTRSLYNSNLTITKKIFKWCYRAPYSLVIDTDDGTNGHEILIKLLKPNTNNVLLLNGVDLPKNYNKSINAFSNMNISNDALKCLFIGKLEIYKGCVTFVDTLIKLIDQGINIHGIIVGVGSEKTRLVDKIKVNKKQKYFTFLGNIDHKDIFYFHEISDLYISLNNLGNFSNVNLEAIKFGQVIILPKNLSATDNNETFDNIIGNKGAIWIKDPSDINGLVQIIKNIYNDRSLLIKYKKLVKKNSNKIPSWSYRINKEIKLLEDLV